MAARLPVGGGFRFLVRGLPVDADHQVQLSIGDVLNAYTLLGGVAMTGLFLFYGAVFIALKTQGAVRDDAVRYARRLALPVTALVAAFGLWTQVAHGNDLTWMVLGGRRDRAAVGGDGVVEPGQRRLGVHRRHGGGSRGGGPVVRFAVSEPGAVHLEPGLEPDDLQRVVDPVHAEDHDAGRR